MSATTEAEVLVDVLRGNDKGATKKLKALNYAELYCLRVGLEKLHGLTCIQIGKTR